MEPSSVEAMSDWLHCALDWLHWTLCASPSPVRVRDFGVASRSIRAQSVLLVGASRFISSLDIIRLAVPRRRPSISVWETQARGIEAAWSYGDSSSSMR